MKKKILRFLVYLVTVSLSVLLLLPISAMAEGDGGWTTAASPGHIFQIEEDLHNNQKHLVMTVLKADETHEIYWGPAPGSVNSTYLLESMNGESDMKATWQFNSVTQATVTVESCTTNCLWQAGKVVIFDKFFGDNQDSQNGQRYGGCDCSGGDLYRGRYCDNGDGTVTDLTSCLVWLKNANCFGKKKWVDSTTWDDAQTSAGMLKSGSCSLADGSRPYEWRLPSLQELYELTNGTEPIRSDTTSPFTGVQDFYWASNTHQYASRYVYIGSPHDGHRYLGDKTSDSRSVWPVRSGN